MEIFSNWRLLIVIYLIIAGVWGVLAKTASYHLNAFTTTFTATTSAWITVALFSYSKLRWQSTIGILTAIVCGIIGGISAIIFYAALKQAPASVVIPVSSLYIFVTVLLSVLFLRETITTQQIIGITLGLAALVLLTS